MRNWFTHYGLPLLRAFNARRVSLCLALFIATLLGHKSLAYAQGLIATYTHTCALTKSSDAGIKCWGNNTAGQLGDGTTTQRLQPVEVVGLSSGVKSIGVGNSFSCALLMNGQVRCWGDNSGGQLGNDSVGSSLSPIPVLDAPAGDPLTGVSSLSVGSTHACVVMESGGAKCWGVNSSGQIGDGSLFSRVIPVDVSGWTANVLAIEAGHNHSCLVTQGANVVYCTGQNAWSQLGDGTSNDTTTPVMVSGLSSAVDANAGGLHSCARLTGGALYCWGDNSLGQLGDGTNTLRSTPVQINSPGTEVERISTGALHTCGIIKTTPGGQSEVFCWGRGADGQVGDGTATQRDIPTALSPRVLGAVDVSSQLNHSCAWMGQCSVKCWGLNSNGQIGNGTTTDAHSPVDVSICTVDPTPTPTSTPTPSATATPLPEACPLVGPCTPDARFTTPLNPRPPAFISVIASTSQKTVRLTVGAVRLGLPTSTANQRILAGKLSRFLGFKVKNLPAAIRLLRVWHIFSIVRLPRIASEDPLSTLALPTKYRTETRSRRVSTRLGPGTYVARVTVRVKDSRGRTFSTGKRSEQTTFTVR
ncbi:MAG: hypothetical protein RL518_582 [Pseudomonadota bacterium]